MIVDVTQMLGDFRPMERLIFRMDQKDVVECVNTSDGNLIPVSSEMWKYLNNHLQERLRMAFRPTRGKI
jgi:hypothetical protein